MKEAPLADEARSPLDQALDLLVFAPVGLALTAREELPRLIARGRAQVTGQLALAKMFGQFAVNHGQKEAQKRAERLVKQVSEPRRPPARPTRVPATNEASHGASVTGNGRQSGAAAAAVASAGAARATMAPMPSADLAIPGYDTLSASQVVQRLGGLSAAELEAVREYETATRGRRTILSKVAQLQTGH